MKKRMLIELIILTLFILVGAAIAHETRNFSVIGKDKEGFIFQPHVAPVLWVKQISGPAIPEKGSLNCTWKPEAIKTPKGDTIHILAGYCEGGVVVHLISMDLNN